MFELQIINHESLTLKNDAIEWLHSLPGSVVIELPHADPDKPWRIISVLVHGNEPSGFIAVHRLLSSEWRATTSVAIIIASVRAARHPPVFSRRMLEGEYDLNRRFGRTDNSSDIVSRLATSIANYIRSKQPELVVDLHNTSGSGPAFSVSTSDELNIRQLSGFFCDTQVVTHLIVGSLMEQDFGCPVVTIECGGSAESHAHLVAERGLRLLLAQDDWQQFPPVERLYYHPNRVVIAQGCSLQIAAAQDPDAQLTIRADLESFNWHGLKQGELLGWSEEPIDNVLALQTEQTALSINDWFEKKGVQIISKKNLRIFMATPRVDIVLSDCLLYLV